MFYIIDRRSNPQGKSTGNNERFKRRARSAIKSFVDQAVNDGNTIKQLGHSGSVKIQTSAIHEPRFHLNHKRGDFIYVLPGNTKDNFDNFVAYIEGDLIPKPSSGGRGSEGSPDGSEDDFEFALTEEEKYDLLFEDLELPNQEETVKDATAFNRTKAGFVNSGSPANFSLKRTMRNSIGRRMSLNRPKMSELEDLETELLNEIDSEQRKTLLHSIEALKIRMLAVPYLDDVDVKFHNVIKVPKPVFKAVMFCVMDVSGSMSEHMKDLAKRFYILLYHFLKKKYKKVEVVFIKHHHVASTVDEQDFFYGKESGGTVVSTALDELMKHITETYDPEDYNIYVAQASDGDNTRQDNPITEKLLRESVLPVTQYYAYLEIGRQYDYNGYSRESDLWPIYYGLHQEFPTKFIPKKANSRADIFPVFRELFQKKV